jgi:hypothetical protein
VKYVLFEPGVDMPEEYRDIVRATSVVGGGNAVNKNTVYMPLVVAFIVQRNTELGDEGYDLEIILSMMLASKRQFVDMFKPVLEDFYRDFSVFRGDCNPRLLPIQCRRCIAYIHLSSAYVWS